jgi:hypothetical protein
MVTTTFLLRFFVYGGSPGVDHDKVIYHAGKGPAEYHSITNLITIPMGAQRMAKMAGRGPHRLFSTHIQLGPK